MSSWHPTGRNRLQFVAEEFWPGGGENGDGRDLYGVAEHYEAWREETTKANLIVEALHPDDADYFYRVGEEEFGRDLDEMETEADPAISVDGQPLEEVVDEYDDDPYREFDRRPHDEYDNLPDGKDGPDSLELARTSGLVITREVAIDPWCVVVPRRWNQSDIEPIDSEFEGLVSSCTSEASRDLARFERDGIRQIGLRIAATLTVGWMAFERKSMMRRWNAALKPWKRHRWTQYRTRGVNPAITDRAYRDAA